MRANIKVGISLLVMVCLFSCTTERKATNWMVLHPKVLSELCGSKYPVKTEYIQGEETIKIDTINIPGIVIPCPEQKPGEKPSVVKCPDSKTIINNVTRVDTISVENTAKIESLNFQLVEANHQVSEQKERADQLEHDKNKYGNYLIIAIAFIILFGLLLIKK